MKRRLILIVMASLCLSAGAQISRTDALQKLEKGQTAGGGITATLNSSSRLFADQNDLTSVITILPAGSVLDVQGSDSTFLKVSFEGTSGYVYASHAVLNKATPSGKEEMMPVESLTRAEQAHLETAARLGRESDRLSGLVRKYGSNIAGRIYEGKIWKGMTAEMIQDSWGSPRKIEKTTSENLVKEQWFYRNTWLYLQNNRLLEWGPVK